MLYRTPDLQDILRENKIRGWSHFNKPQLIDLLKERNLLPEEPEKTSKDIASKYVYLRKIRTRPRSVEVTNKQTSEVTVYPSIYKAGLAFKTNPRLITFYDRRVFRDIYLIKVLDTD